MFRYKTSKQAILIAALVILLCLVCLTGATLALFTSNEEDGKIGIITTSGSIDVDIISETTKQSLKGKTLAFVRDGKHVDALFEPGATFRTEGFRIENTGNISIRFRLHISNDKTMDMEAFNRGFEVWIATEDGTTVPMEKFSQVLLAGDTSNQVYYLCVHMKESAGNEFNRKEQATYSGIGITVYAVQGNADVENVKTGA